MEIGPLVMELLIVYQEIKFHISIWITYMFLGLALSFGLIRVPSCSYVFTIPDCYYSHVYSFKI